ncbi:MAG: glycerol-3-phosphate acyltransferase PlsY [Rickettsiales bacterium]|jgi:glycerol-3-phosphate acyltransferase PlsY
MIYLYQILFLALTYFVASIPFGLVLAKIFGKQDIRKAGSGNIGATNVARILGKKIGFATLILDAAKGAVMVIIAKYLFTSGAFSYTFISLVAAVAVIGHVFPIYLKFKGGKGVATSLAVLLALNPIIGLVCCFAWIIIFLFIKTSSISSLSAILITAGFSLYSRASTPEILLVVFLAFIIFLRHKENIGRILNGTEPASKRKKKK